MIRAALIACLTVCAAPVLALDCRADTVEGNRYAICEVDPATETLDLLRADSSGRAYGDFTTIEKERGQLLFAMNAGMYHEDRSPVGLYIEDGQQQKRLVTSAGPGNFGLLPNGVFCLGEGTARVYETLAYEAEQPDCRAATQSGPMLVIDGKLHPRFLPDSTSRYIRNGVGTSKDGSRVVFVISDVPVTFHEFGRLFRDTLGLDDALYFDGKISRLLAAPLGRADGGFRMGPVVALFADQADG